MRSLRLEVATSTLEAELIALASEPATPFREGAKAALRWLLYGDLPPSTLDGGFQQPEAKAANPAK